ncbi:MAG TPA: DMT family transporter [Caulobacterales bacterium]|nr:DMT family transporter [Caulobacterales bacterium]
MNPAGWTLASWAFAAGMLLPLQALINARLGHALGSPLWASCVQNVVGALAMGCVIMLSRAQAPSAGAVAVAPPWAWVGGALGMVFVFSALMAAPQIGTARTMTAVVAGQLLSSIVLDEFGVLHPRRPVNAEAVAGVVLVALGATLILRRG